MKSNIVHRYLKKETSEGKVLLQIDPIRNQVQEIVLHADGRKEIQQGPLDVPPDELKREGFEDATPIEFHLHLSGLL
jgi:hypothetical protein